MSAGSPWLVTPFPRPGAGCRLVCLPCAGSGPTMYRRWAQRLPADVELVAVSLPGHESRYREPLPSDLVALAVAIGDAVAGAVERPYLMFGHSMGAMLAYEVCRWLADTGRGPLPETLTVSAAIGPDLPRDTGVRGLTPRQLVERLAGLGGTDPRILNDPDMMELVLPVVRADLVMVEDYRPTAGPPLDLELVSVAGADDHRAPAARMAGWLDVATRSSAHVRPGGHFYFNDPANRDWLLGCFAERAARSRI